MSEKRWLRKKDITHSLWYNRQHIRRFVYTTTLRFAASLQPVQYVKWVYTGDSISYSMPKKAKGTIKPLQPAGVRILKPLTARPEEVSHENDYIIILHRQ